MLIKLRYNLVVFIVTAIALIITSIATAGANSSCLQQGKQYYDLGRYSEAIELWQQVAREDINIENKILGYNYLAIAYQDLAQWQESREAINSAFNLLETINNNNSFLYQANARRSSVIALSSASSIPTSLAHFF